MSGPISDRLRKLFKPTDPAWTPPRGTPPPKPVPKGVEGRPLKGRKR